MPNERVLRFVASSGPRNGDGQKVRRAIDNSGHEGYCCLPETTFRGGVSERIGFVELPGGSRVLGVGDGFIAFDRDGGIESYWILEFMVNRRVQCLAIVHSVSDYYSTLLTELFCLFCLLGFACLEYSSLGPSVLKNIAN